MNETFELTEGHLRLLGQAYVRWSEMEWGAPEIDGKRPYGNGDIHEDIAHILGRTDLLDESRSSTPSIRMQPGDRPVIENLGPCWFLLPDGSHLIPDLYWSSFSEMEQWFDAGAHDIALIKARLYAELGDDAGDALVYGEEPAA